MKKMNAVVAIALGLTATAGVAGPAKAEFPWVDVTPLSADCVQGYGIGHWSQISIVFKNIGTVEARSIYVYFDIPGVTQGERRVDEEYVRAGETVDKPIAGTPTAGQYSVRIRLVSSTGDMNNDNNNGTFTVTCPPPKEEPR